jgi:riboflavin synthase
VTAVFSGLVRGVGRILERVDAGGDRRLTIGIAQVRMPRPEPGASVAVNGVCLTAVDCGVDRFETDVSAETLAVTTLGDLTAGTGVNLEPALKVGDPLDGHWVTGHVDGVGRIVTIEPAGGSLRLVVEAPAELGRYVARKGSIAVDGVSLTVNAVDDARFEVNVIPHTREMTVIGGYAPGHAVNIEVDIIARYLERLGRDSGAVGLDREKLRRHGYASDD